jgi:hypothetical protein
MTGWLWRAGASRPRRRKVYDSATMAQAIALVAGPMVNPRCKNQHFWACPPIKLGPVAWRDKRPETRSVSAIR